MSAVLPEVQLVGVPSRRRPERRDELLVAALAVIRRDGAQASMDDMAAEAGITKPVLYRYFGDREGLIGAVGERFSGMLVERLVVALARVPADEAGAESQIRAAIDAYVGFIEEDPALYGFLTQQAPPDSPVLIAVIDRVAGLIGTVLSETLEAAGLDAAPALTWAHGIVGMVHLAGARWARNPEGDREVLVDQLTALAAYGLIGVGVPAQPARPPRGRRLQQQV